MLGRKNWLFAGSESAGRRAAVIMGLLATAKASGHAPHAWLSDVLTGLPTTLYRDIAAYRRPENKVSLGFVEGLNNKIRVIQCRAHGLRDEEYLRLKELTCMLPEL